MQQQLDKFPSDDFVILEPVFQNDSFLNFRAFNKLEGSFTILKYVSLDQTDTQTETFFSLLQALNETESELFIRNQNIFIDDSSNSDPNSITLVFLMQNNVASLKQILQGRKEQNQMYNEEEFVDLIFQLTLGFYKMQNPDLRAKACFSPEGLFLVPSITPPDFDNDVYELNTKYRYQINNFDYLLLGNCIDSTEENLVSSMSQFIFQLLEANPDQLSPEIFGSYPALCNLLREMMGGHLNLEKLLAKLEKINHHPPDETPYLSVNPELPDMTEIERVKNYEALVDGYNSLGFYTAALKSANLKFQYYKENNPKSEEYARALNDLGVLLWRCGNFEEAKRMLLEALDLMKEIYGPQHLAVAIATNNLGLVFEDLNDFDQALIFLEKSYELKISIGNTEKMANVLINLGSFHLKNKHDEEKAKNFFENAYEIRAELSSNSEQSSSVAVSLNNLAVFHANRGNLDNALEYLEQEKKLTENYLNENFIICLNNLGYVLMQKKNFYEAKTHFANSMLLLAKQLKMKTQLSAIVISNYAYLCYQFEHYTKAMNLLEKAIELKAFLFGPNSETYAISSNNLGETYLKLGRFDEAIQFLRKSLEIKEALLGAKLYSNPKKLLITLNNIGYAYIKVMDLEQAKSYFFRAITIDETDIATLNNLGLYSSLTDRLGEAVEYYSKALEFLLSSKGENNEEAMRIHNNLGAVFLKMKDYEKAENSLRTSLRIAEAVFPEKIELAEKVKERLGILERVREKNERAIL